jgi:high affinity sulfate transporter 1
MTASLPGEARCGRGRRTATGNVRQIERWFPIVAQLRGYGRSSFGRDVSAGLVLTALLVPAGMGYAVAAGLPAVNGLYATIVPLVVYALVGPSRILVFGPDSSLAPLILAAVVPLAAGDPAEAVTLAAMLSILAGLLCALAGLLRLGFVADLLSTPVRYGYVNGIALTVFVSQLPKLFGFSTDGDDLISVTRGFVEGVRDGDTILWALVLGVGALVLILVVRWLAPAWPGTLAAVLAGMATVAALGLSDEIPVVGELPQGLPTPAWPDVSAGTVAELFPAALGIAFISFADTSVLSRTFALRTRSNVDPGRELVALGSVNVASGFFQGFAVSGSSSRTPVAEEAGARTQVTGLVGAAGVTLLIVLAPGLFRDLPSSVLAAVVIAASLRLVELHGVARLARIRRSEFLLSLVAFAGVALFGAIVGVGLAVGLSLLDVMRRAWRPHTAELVRVDGLKGYHDVERHPEGRRVPGLLLYRFDAPLFFANAGYFAEDVLRAVDAAPAPLRWVVITAEPITDVDVTAAHDLHELLDDLATRDVTLAFAEMKGPIRDALDSYGLVERIGEERFFRTVGQAVKAYTQDADIDWIDWEDRPPEN